jgi:hypothetical protein
VLNPQDNRGWFQWYVRYWLGRREDEMDKKQIELWKQWSEDAEKIKEKVKDTNDKETMAAERQNLLQWAHDAQIDVPKA